MVSIKHSTDNNIKEYTTTSYWFNITKKYPFLLYGLYFHLILLIPVCIAFFLDERTLLGINIWIKPIKFWVSAIILLATIPWYLEAFNFSQRSKNIIAILFSVLLSLENVLISTQAFRAVTSHYNIQTRFDALVFSTMGTAIGILTVLAFWIFLKSFAPSNLNKTMTRSVQLAWFGYLFSAVVGGFMISNHAHTVGAADGGSGIPFFNWSNQVGDLRIAHFLGLHAIQVIPLFTYFIQKNIKNKQWSNRLGIGFALLFLIWIAFVFWQAQMGQPFIKAI